MAGWATRPTSTLPPQTHRARDPEKINCLKAINMHTRKAGDLNTQCGQTPQTHAATS